MNKVTFWQEKELKMYHFGINPEDIKAVAEHKCNHIFFNTPLIEVVCEELPQASKTYAIEFFATFAGCDERVPLAAQEYLQDSKGLKRYVKNYIIEELMFNEYDDSLWLGLMKEIARSHKLDDVWEDEQ